MTPLVLWFLAGCSSPPPAAPVASAPARAAPDDAIADDAPAPKGPPPEISGVRFAPPHPKMGEDVEVQLKIKNPANAQLSYDYLWSINDTPSYDLTTNVFPGVQDTRGDRLQVKITVSDGTHEVSRDSPVVEIGNSPPTLLTTTAELAHLDGLEVRATDPDDDTLTCSFEGAPSSLTISDSGRVRYQASETEKAGTYAVTLVVDDGHTGFAKLPFKITVAGGAPQQRVKKGASADGATAAEESAAQTSP